MTTADLTAFLKKHPLSVGCALVALVCGGLLYYRSSSIAEGEAELETKTSQASKVAANVRNSTGLSEQVRELQSQTKELESRLIKVGQLAVNLQYFYKLEAETGVKLVDARQNQVARSGKDSAYVRVPFSVTVQGTYAQLATFLTQLQGGRHFCRVNTATFNKSGGSNATQQEGVQMTLSLNLELLGQS